MRVGVLSYIRVRLRYRSRTLHPFLRYPVSSQPASFQPSRRSLLVETPSHRAEFRSLVFAGASLGLSCPRAANQVGTNQWVARPIAPRSRVSSSLAVRSVAESHPQSPEPCVARGPLATRPVLHNRLVTSGACRNRKESALIRRPRARGTNRRRRLARSARSVRPRQMRE